MAFVTDSRRTTAGMTSVTYCATVPFPGQATTAKLSEVLPSFTSDTNLGPIYELSCDHLTIRFGLSWDWVGVVLGGG